MLGWRDRISEPDDAPNATRFNDSQISFQTAQLALHCQVYNFSHMYDMQSDESSEWDEAEKDVKAAEAAKVKQNGKPTNGGKAIIKTNGKQQDALSQLFSPVFLEAFVLTFCAEWGDRSQIATIGGPSCCARCLLLCHNIVIQQRLLLSLYILVFGKVINSFVMFGYNMVGFF